MTAGLFVLVCVAGGLGAAARLALDGVVRARTGSRLPWGTALINVTGSFALGLVAGLATRHALPEAWHAVVGTGFLGGYTTFSTASHETVRLAQERRWAAAFANAVGVAAVAVAAAGAGLALAALG